MKPSCRRHAAREPGGVGIGRKNRRYQGASAVARPAGEGRGTPRHSAVRRHRRQGDHLVPTCSSTFGSAAMRSTSIARHGRLQPFAAHDQVQALDLGARNTSLARPKCRRRPVRPPRLGQSFARPATPNRKCRLPSKVAKFGISGGDSAPLTQDHGARTGQYGRRSARRVAGAPGRALDRLQSSRATRSGMATGRRTSAPGERAPASACRDAGGKAEIVLDAGGSGRLSAERALVEHQHGRGPRKRHRPRWRGRRGRRRPRPRRTPSADPSSGGDAEATPASASVGGLRRCHSDRASAAAPPPGRRDAPRRRGPPRRGGIGTVQDSRCGQKAPATATRSGALGRPISTEPAPPSWMSPLSSVLRASAPRRPPPSPTTSRPDVRGVEGQGGAAGRARPAGGQRPAPESWPTSPLNWPARSAVIAVSVIGGRRAARPRSAAQ